MPSTLSNYQIKVRGRIDPSWSDRLNGMRIEPEASSEEPVTVLTGELADQSALTGVLNSLVDLHTAVISVECLDETEPNDAQTRRNHD